MYLLLTINFSNQEIVKCDIKYVFRTRSVAGTSEIEL